MSLGYIAGLLVIGAIWVLGFLWDCYTTGSLMGKADRVDEYIRASQALDLGENERRGWHRYIQGRGAKPHVGALSTPRVGGALSEVPHAE